MLPHGGFDRPSHCQFGLDGALYVVDFGEIQIAPEVGGIRVRKGTGVLWRIRRSGDGVPGDKPRDPVMMPVYGIRAILTVVGVVGGVGLLIRFLKR